MPVHALSFQHAIVRKVAAGIGGYPDTFELAEKIATPIIKGLSLALYTQDGTIFTHQGWFRVLHLRVAETHASEFTLQRIDMGIDAASDEVLHLVVAKGMTMPRKSKQRWGATLVKSMKKLVAHVIPHLPPPPSASSLCSPSPSPTSAMLASQYDPESNDDPRSPRQSIAGDRYSIAVDSSMEGTASSRPASSMLDM